VKFQFKCLPGKTPHRIGPYTPIWSYLPIIYLPFPTPGNSTLPHSLRLLTAQNVVIAVTVQQHRICGVYPPWRGSSAWSAYRMHSGQASFKFMPLAECIRSTAERLQFRGCLNSATFGERLQPQIPTSSQKKFQCIRYYDKHSDRMHSERPKAGWQNMRCDFSSSTRRS
jgi:hypothetical protein